jgi:hypothetical protein
VSSPSRLLVENSATHWTFRRLLTEESSVDILVYGAAGSLFTRPTAPGSSLYFSPEATTIAAGTLTELPS